jgi:transposase InsO family protein
LEYHSYLTSHKILQSWGLKSYPQCNAPNESFFSTLKMDININSLSKMNNDVIVHEVKKWIKKYNNERFHSSIGKKPFEVYFKKELGNNKLVK